MLESSFLAPLAKVPVSLLEACVIPGFESPAMSSKMTFFQTSDESAAVDLPMDSERARMLPIDQQSAVERVANIKICETSELRQHVVVRNVVNVCTCATQTRCVVPHVAVRAWPIGLIGLTMQTYLSAVRFSWQHERFAFKLPVASEFPLHSSEITCKSACKRLSSTSTAHAIKRLAERICARVLPELHGLQGPPVHLEDVLSRRRICVARRKDAERKLAQNS